MLDVDETSRFHLLYVDVRDVGAHGSAHFARGFAEELAPAEEVGVGGGAIGGFDREAVVLEFEPAAGFEVSEETESVRAGWWLGLSVEDVLVSLPEEIGPVRETACH